MAWYVVFVGRKTGVFSDWPTCKAQVSGLSHSSYQKFQTLEEALRSFQSFRGASGNEAKHHQQYIAAITAEGVKQEEPRNYKDLIILVQALALVVCLISMWFK